MEDGRPALFLRPLATIFGVTGVTFVLLLLPLAFRGGPPEVLLDDDEGPALGVKDGVINFRFFFGDGKPVMFLFFFRRLELELATLSVTEAHSELESMSLGLTKFRLFFVNFFFADVDEAVRDGDSAPDEVSSLLKMVD